MNPSLTESTKLTNLTEDSLSETKSTDSKKAKSRSKVSPHTSEFDLWWAQHGKPSESLKQQVRYLIDYYEIDPLLGDINILYQSGRWVPHITMDGWMKIINQHPAFCGIDFQEAQELMDGVPQWISCTIYRHDRVIPITVREYYAELKQESALWLEIPRRLLRFRSMQQCARLALSLSTPEFSFQPLDHMKSTGNSSQHHPHSESPQLTQLEKIKTKVMKDPSPDLTETM